MSYTEEFRREAVKLYRTGDKGVDRTAKGLGIATETLRKWIRWENERDQGLEITERERLRLAEKELKRLREENEILIKAAAFFAQETAKGNRKKYSDSSSRNAVITQSPPCVGSCG